MADSSAYLSVLKQNTPLLILDGNIPQFDYSTIINDGIGIKNQYANNFHRSLKESSSPFSKKWFDESVVLYLHKTQYFNTDSTASEIRYCRIKSSVNQSEIKKSIIIILEGLSRNQNQVFSIFPMDTSNYTDEVKIIMNECIEKYGINEWVSTVLTNEMHRHLGIYAVIGSKMGIRAREYFGAGVDEIQIISYAGLNPPFSCMNDGLQISTGATLGHGLISLISDTLKLPKADFIYMNRKITIKLKDKYKKQVEREIKNLVLLYGLDNNLYWDLVRKLAIDYWKYWDRHEIFNLETLN
jgi:pyrimidine-specific ribonucleoside hydrolase